MSKRARSLRHRTRAAVPAVPTAVPAAFDNGGGVGNDGNRGTVIFPFAKSKDHLKGYNRREAVRLSQWATWKMGAARMATLGLAGRAGVVNLAADTSDSIFNAAHTEWWQEMFEKRSGNYDVTGKFTASGFARNAVFCAFRDGDIGIVHTTGENGEPLLMAVESSIIRTAQTADGWCDGVHLDPRGRPIEYSIMAGDGYRDASATVVSARDFFLLANYETHDSVRGTPALFSTLDRVRDLREIDNAAIKAAKIQALIALYFKREMGAVNDVIPNLSGKVKFQNLAGQGTQTTAAYGAPSNIPRRVQEVFDDAEVFDGLSPGVEPKILNDGRDYSAQTPLKEDIYRQIAWGLGLDEHILFGFKGMTGPEVRKVLGDFQRWRENWQAMQLNFLTIDYLRRTEWAIRTRQIPRPKDPAWWKFIVNYPAAATIDAGRDAASQDKRLGNFTTNLSLEYGEMGMGWQAPAKQRLAEKAFLKKEGMAMGLTEEEIFGKDAAPQKPADGTSAELAELKSSIQLIMEKLQID